jgi:DNA-binding response OmpR family regulator
MRLMLVEDDDRVAAALIDGLRRQSIDVLRASTGQQALSAVGDGSGFDVILLDLGLPDGDGLGVCRQIREVADVPIIMVTARADMRSRVHGLHLGADDYVTKPFDLRELLARIHAVVRRTGPARGAGGSGETGGARGAQVASALGVQLDLARREVTVNGTPVTLTRKEFNLLAMLARQPGVVFSRAHIISEVWDSAWTGHQRTLEVHVASVRSKLGVPEVIETVRGVGYRFPAG